MSLSTDSRWGRGHSPSLTWLRRVAAVLAASTFAGAVAAPFTYQGRLVDGAALGNGNYELTFRLFDNSFGGSQVGNPVVHSPVTVTNGLFTVDLDFGDAAFSGAPRWLELTARLAGGPDGPETLAPRQPIHAVPYAMRAFAGSGDASELVVGTVPDARLSANIPRAADLTTLSNTLAARISALEAALQTVSNQVQSIPPVSVAAVSSLPSDPALLAAGWARFSSVPSPTWANGNSGGPTARSGHSAVWTGQSWIVWGGTLGAGTLSATGSSYDPTTDQWTPVSELNPPAARQGHAAVWTGTSMLVWGGIGTGGALGTGAAYVPGTGQWSPLPNTSAPAPRQEHVAVWTGTGLLVWGGRNATGLLNDGKIHDPDPLGQAWTDLPGANAPEARIDAQGVWTGSRFVVWGGQGAVGHLATGAMLPVTGGLVPGAWVAMNAANSPSARSGHTLIWTGSRVLVWGGQQAGTALATGASFDPGANAWTAISTTGAPTARWGHVAVWTGSEMLVFGGQTASGAVATGAAYNPATDAWRPLSTGGNPLARSQAAGAWTGSELLVFGGLSGSTPVASLQRLTPQPTWYFYRKP